MKRSEKLTTSVTPDEKREFKIIAAEEGYSTQAELLRDLVYDKLEAEGRETSRTDEGDPAGNPRATAAD